MTEGLQPVRHRLAELRARGDAASAPLWIEALPPDRALAELSGRRDPLSRLQRARALLALGRPAEAREALEGETLGGGLARFQEALLAQVGEPAAGEPTPPAEAEGEEEPALASRTLAELHAAQGDREAAVQIYREVLARDPSDAASRSRLRQLLGVAPERPQEALRRWLEGVRGWRRRRSV